MKDLWCLALTVMVTMAKFQKYQIATSNYFHRKMILTLKTINGVEIYIQSSKQQLKINIEKSIYCLFPVLQEQFGDTGIYRHFAFSWSPCMVTRTLPIWFLPLGKLYTSNPLSVYNMKSTIKLRFCSVFMLWFIVAYNQRHAMCHHRWMQTLENFAILLKCFNFVTYMDNLFLLLLFIAFVLSCRSECYNKSLKAT